MSEKKDKYNKLLLALGIITCSDTYDAVAKTDTMVQEEYQKHVTAFKKSDGSDNTNDVSSFFLDIKLKKNKNMNGFNLGCDEGCK